MKPPMRIMFCFIVTTNIWAVVLDHGWKLAIDLLVLAWGLYRLTESGTK